MIPEFNVRVLGSKKLRNINNLLLVPSVVSSAKITGMLCGWNAKRQEKRLGLDCKLDQQVVFMLLL
jgi:hypothetical protein